MTRLSRRLAATAIGALLFVVVGAVASRAHVAPDQHRERRGPATLEIDTSGPTTAAEDPPGVDAGPTPRAQCGPGSNPETGTQGRVPLAEVQSGRAAQGYTCNTTLLGRFGDSGGYKVERYRDAAGHECAYYDTTLLFPGSALTGGQNLTGVYVLDMSDPSKPVRTESLLTPAMQSPHESMELNAKRGLLVAVTANPVTYPGVVDVYDVSQDCRHPILRSSMPVGVLGHESGFAPDGKTFYVAALDGGQLTAVDLTNPSLPLPLWTTRDFRSHGLSISDDGNRAYLADRTGLVILDVSQIQARLPNPQHRVVSTLTWGLRSTPQITIPITIQGHPYLIEMDEFANGEKVGAARIIDIADDTKPKVISNIRLEVNQAENRPGQAADPGASNGLQGYAGHYCEVPTRVDPGVVVCTFILSGLRLFDIRDPFHPKEIAYFNAPVKPGRTGGPGSNYAMSQPALVPERGELWYSDGNSGFYAVKVTNGVWPFGLKSSDPAPPLLPDLPDVLPSTGTAAPLGAAVLVLVLGLAVRRQAARDRS